MASLFDTLETQAFRAGIEARTKKSQNWFRKKVKELGTVSQRKLLMDPAVTKVTKPRIGDMVMYFYDPKLKEVLIDELGKSPRQIMQEDGTYYREKKDKNRDTLWTRRIRKKINTLKKVRKK